MVGLPTRPRLAVTPEKLEEGSVNIISRRGYSTCGGSKWRNKSQEREYLTRLCRSLIDHGAPAHHLEGQCFSLLLLEVAKRTKNI